MYNIVSSIFGRNGKNQHSITLDPPSNDMPNTSIDHFIKSVNIIQTTAIMTL